MNQQVYEHQVGAYNAHIERAVAEAAIRHDVFKKVMAAAGILVSVWGTALFAKEIQSISLLWLPVIGMALSAYLLVCDQVNYARERAHIEAAFVMEPSVRPYNTASVMQKHLKPVPGVQASAKVLFFVFVITALVTAQKLHLLWFN